MAKQTGNNIKLGVFVIAGLVLLVTGLYIIGKNHSMFGSKFELKARFSNVSGLVPGNNVRFSGIQAGTVKSLEIINDTTIEVVLLIDKTTREFIRKNAIVSIGSEGLMGNRVVNIYPGKGEAAMAEEGDMLATKPIADMEDAMETLYTTNDNVRRISEQLLSTMERINSSPALWGILEDSTLPVHLRVSLANIRKASNEISTAAAGLDEMVKGVEQGEGVAGILLKDTSAERSLSNAIRNIQKASAEADQLVTRLDKMAMDIESGRDSSVAGLLLGDTSVAGSINRSLSNIEEGTKSFSENMEALKHNFLFRGYFRKKEKNK
jgi:phospholipid/cholesterol/gamma-HCH transport system substrate-binding protein